MRWPLLSPKMVGSDSSAGMTTALPIGSKSQPDPGKSNSRRRGLPAPNSDFERRLSASYATSCHRVTRRSHSVSRFHRVLGIVII